LVVLLFWRGKIAKPVERSHPPVWRGCHGAGANLGGDRCTVKSNEAATTRVTCGMASDLIEARKSAAVREEKKKKREIKKNKEQWDPLMARNKYLVDILTEGGKAYLMKMYGKKHKILHNLVRL
jgi:hypothetical protein